MSAPWDDPRVRDGLPQQFAARRAQLEAGAKRLGWKVGFGAPASLELMQIEGPLLGYLTDATLRESGALVDVSSWDRGVVEFELAVHIGRDVPPGADEQTIRNSVAAIAPSIELANINLPIAPESVACIVAGNIFHEGIVLGEADSDRAGLDIDGLEAIVTIDGAEFSRTDRLEELTGRYLDVVAAVASTVATQGEMLRAGDVIITGSVFPPLPVEEGSVWEFTLHPFPPISVQLITTPASDGG